MRRLFLLALGIFALSPLFSQVSKNLDSLYFSEMMSRRVVDEFTGEIRIDCPVLGNPQNTIHLIKNISAGRAVYFMRLMTHGSSVVVDGTGVILLFSDGSKITKPSVEIDVDVSDNGYEYTAFFLVNLTDLKTLASKDLKKYRLYIFDGVVNEKDSEDFRIYASQIIKTK